MTREEIEKELHRLRTEGINADQEDKTEWEEYVDAIAARRMISELEEKLRCMKQENRERMSEEQDQVSHNWMPYRDAKMWEEQKRKWGIPITGWTSEPAGADVVMTLADGSKQVTHIPMEKKQEPVHTNYMQTIEGSQWVTTLEQIAMQLAGIKSRADVGQYGVELQYEGDMSYGRVTSIQQDIDHLLVAVENAIKKGFYIQTDGTK